MDQDLFDIEERFLSSQLKDWLLPQEPTASGSMSQPKPSVRESTKPAGRYAESAHPTAARSERPGTETTIDDVLLDILNVEARSHLPTIEDWIENFVRSPQLASEGLVRAFQTINGAFAMADVPEITDVTSTAEQVVKRLFIAELVPSPKVVDQLRNASSSIRLCLEALQETPAFIPRFTSTSTALRCLRDELPELRASHGDGPLSRGDNHVDYMRISRSVYDHDPYGEVSYKSVDARILSDESSEGPPPWVIGFSKQFKKDTSGLDRKLMGRILEVLEEVADYMPPFSPRGDTFKPLVGELAGCWRSLSASPLSRV